MDLDRDLRDRAVDWSAADAERESSDPVVDDVGARGVVIGIDGADWKLIDELAAGEGTPNLTRSSEPSTSGPKSTLTSIALSPVIWILVAK